MKPSISRLDEVSDVIDSLHKTPQYSEYGLPMVRATDVKYGVLNLDNTLKVNQSVFDEFSRRYKPSINDIVITRVGSYGITSLVKDTNFCLGQNTSVIIPKINPRYLYAAINSPQIKNQIEYSVVGSTQKTLSLKAINSLEIPRFEKDTEDKIAHILSTLDDKIELNRKMNQTLEEMAQALFKSWFVDFDPVHAKAKCSRDEELETAAKELGISKEILELFPNEFEESELGMIPEGWKANQLNSIFTERKEKVNDRTDTVVMSVVQTGEILNPKDVFTKQVHSKDISKYKLLYPHDLGFNPSRINIGSAGFNKLEMMGAMSPVYTVMKFNNTKYFSYMELFMKKRSTKKWIEVLASGSVRQSLSQKDFLSIPVVIPADNLLEAFNSVYDSFQAKVNSFKSEIDILEKTRNTLLPKLLSGELDVSELEFDMRGN